MFVSPGSRAGRKGAAFPAGTRMLFQQSSAPPGWRKDATHNDKALRIVSGSVAGGGSIAFSTVFGRTSTDAHTLAVSEIPSHTHPSAGASNVIASGSNFNSHGSGAGDATGATGGGGAHSHGMDIRVQYVDVIIAEKE